MAVGGICPRLWRDTARASDGGVIGTFVSPFSPALWLALGLARAEMGKYLRIAFPICWAFSVALVLGSWAVGVFA